MPVIPAIGSQRQEDFQLEASKTQKTNYTNTWRLNSALLNKVTEEIREEILKFLESSENENMTYQSLWDTARAVVRGEFLSMSAYILKKIRDL
jgi:hypothetical protein